MKKIKLDNEEKDIEKNHAKYKKISRQKKNRIEDIIDKTGEKSSITIRLNNYDLDLIRKIASEEGLPYQSLISSVLHKFVTNRLIDKKNIAKIIKNSG